MLLTALSCHKQLDKLRSQFVELIQQEHQIQQHKQALAMLANSYQPSLEKTDFAEVLQENMDHVQAVDRCAAAAV